MAMEDYEAAAALIANHLDDADFEAQSEERVARAEEALGLRFPPSYRRFLVEYGSGGVEAEEIYGVVNDDFEDFRPPQAIGLTRRMRRDGHISDALIVIYAVGEGTYFALDTAQANADGEAPVVAFMPGGNTAGDTLEIVAPDFGAFFLATMRADLE
jgi:hypothetical protein